MAELGILPNNTYQVMNDPGSAERKLWDSL